MFLWKKYSYFDSFSICLISDIWTSKTMYDLMGIAVNVINRKFERQTLVIGMELMPGAHNAPNIISSIQSIVNKYKELDKSSIDG